MSGFYHKHFLKLLDFTPAELNTLLQLAAKLKADKKSGKEEAKLTGKNIALIFEKDSTRTRCSSKLPHMTRCSCYLSRPKRQPDWS